MAAFILISQCWFVKSKKGHIKSPVLYKIKCFKGTVHPTMKSEASPSHPDADGQSC